MTELLGPLLTMSEEAFVDAHLWLDGTIVMLLQELAAQRAEVARLTAALRDALTESTLVSPGQPQGPLCRACGRHKSERPVVTGCQHWNWNTFSTTGGAEVARLSQTAECVAQAPAHLRTSGPPSRANRGEGGVMTQ